MAGRFLCCNFGRDEESNPIPNRPIEDTKTELEQNKMTPVPEPSDTSYPQSDPVSKLADTPYLQADPVSKPSASSSSQAALTPEFLYRPNHEGVSTAEMERRGDYESLESPSGPFKQRPRSEGPPSSQQPPAYHTYDPPTGPPPDRSLDKLVQEEHNPIPTENPPPYHNWQDAVPDTTVFPPPPANAYTYSNAGNASEADANRAHDFCDSLPLWNPVTPSTEVYNHVRSNKLNPVRPVEYQGDLTVIENGKWKGKTQAKNRDCVLLTALPMYFAAKDSPLDTEMTKTIYFEVTLQSLHGSEDGGDAGFSIGYAAQPYPTWRSPGWERGSVGVCSDDGCRFVNDSFGGRDFTTRFAIGETIGLGMTFSLSKAADASSLEVEIFLVRDGSKTGSWSLREERDTDSGSVKGLEGDFDLYGAVGLFGGVEFEVCFDPSGWKWKPSL